MECWDRAISGYVQDWRFQEDTRFQKNPWLEDSGLISVIVCKPCSQATTFIDLPFVTVGSCSEFPMACSSLVLIAKQLYKWSNEDELSFALTPTPSF